MFNFFDLIIPKVIAAGGTGAQAAAQQQPNAFLSFVPFIFIFIIFYFLMIRPQKKKMQEERSFINALSKGDEVFTKSGILGKVTGITDKIVTLEVSEGVKFRVIKSEVSGSTQALFAKVPKKEPMRVSG